MFRTAAILLGGAVALWISIGVTLNLTTAKRAPTLAERWWPVGVTAKVAEGQQLLAAGNPSMAALNRQRARLREAALREPVNTDALSTLAAIDDYRKDNVRARALFRASEAVSRRNTLTELWMIEDAVARGNVAEAVRHYNRAMLVSNEVRPTLLPILVTASANPAILKELLPLLARRPAWWKEYMLQLGASGNNAAVMAAALRATRIDARNAEDATLAQAILRRMIALKDGPAAIVAANRLEGLPGTTRPLREGGFETPGTIAPFAWWLRDEASIRAYRDAVPNGSIGLRITTSSGASGGVAQQLIGLSAGRHVLRGQAGGVPRDSTARPAIDISCESGGLLAHAVLPPSGDDGGNFQYSFMVPATGCALQWVTIVTAPAVDTDIWLDNLAIER